MPHFFRVQTKESLVRDIQQSGQFNLARTVSNSSGPEVFTRSLFQPPEDENSRDGSLDLISQPEQ